MAIGAMNNLLDENWEEDPAVSDGKGWSRDNNTMDHSSELMQKKK